ncbi:MAG: DsbA family protein [Sedimentitalea sp.]
MRRRDLIIAACAVGGVMALPRLRAAFAPEFVFEPLPGLVGFRQLPGGSASGIGSVMAGLQVPSPEQEALRDAVRAAPCASVFGAESWQDGRVPVVVFTDYNCPYCPVLSEIVIDLAESDAPIRPIWKDLPVLGPRSEAAAVVAVAAARQGRYLPVHRQLMRTVLRPGPAALRAIADRHGLDLVQLRADMASPEVLGQIARTKAVAAVFGIIGTPATLVGRTLVVGEIDAPTMRALIDVEQAEPFETCS